MTFKADLFSADVTFTDTKFAIFVLELQNRRHFFTMSFCSFEVVCIVKKLRNGRDQSKAMDQMWLSIVWPTLVGRLPAGVRSVPLSRFPGNALAAPPASSHIGGSAPLAYWVFGRRYSCRS